MRPNELSTTRLTGSGTGNSAVRSTTRERLTTSLPKAGDLMTKHPAAAYESVPEAAERERILMEQLPQVRYIARRIHERLPPPPRALRRPGTRRRRRTDRRPQQVRSVQASAVQFLCQVPHSRRHPRQ